MKTICKIIMLTFLINLTNAEIFEATKDHVNKVIENMRYILCISEHEKSINYDKEIDWKYIASIDTLKNKNKTIHIFYLTDEYKNLKDYELVIWKTQKWEKRLNHTKEIIIHELYAKK